jgi:hypothetical protein
MPLFVSDDPMYECRAQPKGNRIRGSAATRLTTLDKPAALCGN